MKTVLTLAVSFVLAGGLAAQSVTTPPATPAGKWSVTFPNRQGPLAFDLKIDGAAVSGTWDGKPIQGEIANGVATFAAPDDWSLWKSGAWGPSVDQMYLTVQKATLKADGTMSGTTYTYVNAWRDHPGEGVVKTWSWSGTRVAAK